MVEIVGSKDNLMFLGLSTDEKPTKDLNNINIFYELDTGTIYTYSIKNTNPVTSNGWWAM